MASQANLDNRDAHEPQQLLALIIVCLRDPDGALAVLLHVCCLACLYPMNWFQEQSTLSSKHSGRVTSQPKQACSVVWIPACCKYQDGN